MVPLYALAAFTVVAFLLFPFIEKLLIEPVPMTLQMWLGFVIDMVYVKVTNGFLPFVVTMGALALGGIPAYTIYIKNADRKNTIVPERGVLRKIYTFLRHRWYINEAYYWILYRFLRLASWWRTRIDDRVIDGIDFGSATAAIALSTRIRWFDDHVVDGLAEGISGAGLQLSERGQAIQTGRVNDYVSVLIFGVGLMLLILLIMVGVI
ncbi:MAG: hypothetical protein ACTSVT_05280, partial [Candidatus Thorarchaeota archaeon]